MFCNVFLLVHHIDFSVLCNKPIECGRFNWVRKTISQENFSCEWWANHKTVERVEFDWFFVRFSSIDPYRPFLTFTFVGKLKARIQHDWSHSTDPKTNKSTFFGGNWKSQRVAQYIWTNMISKSEISLKKSLFVFTSYQREEVKRLFNLYGLYGCCRRHDRKIATH